MAGILILFAGLIVLFGASAWQKFRCLKAQADKEQLESNLIQSNGETWIREKIVKTENGKKQISIEFARLGGIRHRVNSHDHDPTPSEILYAHTMLTTGQSKQLMPGPYEAPNLIIEQKPNLLDLIDQYPHCHIYGTTGGGKTGLLRTIAYRRQSQGHQVLVLDSTEHPSKWEGLTRIRNRQNQNEAIARLFGIYKQNEEALSTGRAIESDFVQITVISDEWTDIVLDNDLARQFIREQTRKVRKFGLHLVFATQTDLASDLGLDGAYKTTTSFLKVEVKISPDNRRMAIARVGYQQLGIFDLPMPPPLPELVPTGYLAPRLETAKPYIPDEARQVIEMFNGGASYREITGKMWGQVGTFYNNRIDQILKKYSVNK